MTRQLNEIVSELADTISKEVNRISEMNIIAAIIDIYESDYTYSEYVSSVAQYNKDVAEHNYKQMLFNKDESAVPNYMVEAIVLSEDQFNFIRDMRKGNR